MLTIKFRGDEKESIQEMLNDFVQSMSNCKSSEIRIYKVKKGFNLDIGVSGY